MDWDTTYLMVMFYGNLVILVLVASTFLKQNYKNILTIFSITILALIISLRDSKVALDTPNYVELFLRNDESFFNQQYIYETGFIYINKIIYLYTDNYHLLFFFITFTHLFIILLLYKKLSNKFFSLLLAMYISTFVFWLSNLSMLRQGLAIPIIALAIFYLVFKDNKKIFFLLSIIAINIHFSSLFISIFIYVCYYVYKKLKISVLKIFLFVFIFLVLYPKNIFIYAILKGFSLFPQYAHSSYILNKVIWYFEWNKLQLWHIKHVYFLIILLFIMAGIIEKNKKYLLLLLIPTSLIGVFKYDEMVTDRLFMYFVPLIPIIIFRVILRVGMKNYGVIMILLLTLGILVWFNIKLIYIQYPGWFIYPYSKVR